MALVGYAEALDSLKRKFSEASDGNGQLVLSADAVKKVLSRALGPDIALRLTPVYHELSGGNPVLLNALLEDCCRGSEYEGSGDDAQSVGGPAFREAVLACLHQGDPELLEVARGLVVLSTSASLALLGRLLEIKTESVAQAIEALTAAGLLAAGRFRHPAAETVVLGSLTPARRAQLHTRAAELLYRAAAPATDVAAHLVAADRVVAPWAIGVLRKGAAQALATDEVETAITYLELARTAYTDERDRVETTKALVSAQWRVNPYAAASYLPELESALLDGTLATRDIVTLIRVGLWQGDDNAVAQALAALKRSDSLSCPRIPTELRLVSQLFYGHADAFFPDTDAPAPFSGQADMTALSDDPWLRVAETLLKPYSDDICDDSNVIAGAEYMLQNISLDDMMVESVAGALFALLHAGQLVRATSWCDALIDEAIRRGATTWQAFLYGIRADIVLRCGEPAAAAVQAEAALVLLEPRSWGVLVGYPLATLLLANTAMGRRDEAAATLRYSMPASTFQTAIGASYLHARGHYHLSVGELLAAVADFQACGDLMRRVDVWYPELVPWRADLAEAYLQLGRDAEAHELAQLDRSLTTSARDRGSSLCVPHKKQPEHAVNSVLSDAELRVAVLAAAGHTNREIGGRLWITASTVEQHLTRVYRKLGVRGRGDLSAALPLHGIFATMVATEQ